MLQDVVVEDKDVRTVHVANVVSRVRNADVVLKVAVVHFVKHFT
jgi:hypothetical protein